MDNYRYRQSATRGDCGTMDLNGEVPFSIRPSQRTHLIINYQLSIINCEAKRTVLLRFSSQRTKVYNPKTFFLHAALLHQGFPHCAISLTAASRRSLGRVSVPMWPFNLSVRLWIAALVSRYLTNKLIQREPIFQR